MSATVIAPAGVAGHPTARWVALAGDGHIADVGDTPPPAGALEVPGLLAPGFIDLQVNGIGDIDFGTADEAGWRAALRTLAAHGVTSACPTLVTAPLDAYDEPLAIAAAVAAAPGPGEAALLGVHLEGPFLGGAPGAHRRELIRPADPAWLAGVLAAHPGLVRVVTVAPEADPEGEAIRLLAAGGVLVALGHSAATYDEAIAAADAGARAVTHLFSGMGPFHHRAPGLVGAALDDDRLTPTLIADLVHAHPAALRLAFAASRRAALVSDAIGLSLEVRAMGVAPGPDGAPRLPDGTLAGSLLTLDQALRNVVSHGVAFERALAAMTVVPADLLGDPARGRIAPGARADLVALHPQRLTVEAVWLAGERSAESAPTPSPS